MKKNKLAGIIGATVIGIGAAIGIGELIKKGKNNDVEDCVEVYDDETYEEVNSEDESEE